MTTTKSYDYLNRLTGITSSAGGSNVAVFNFANNSANQRTAITNVDGSYWIYQYDSLGQVTWAKKHWSDGSLVAGQQSTFSFDDIGNRKTTASGGDQVGLNQRFANYTNNLLNQITGRDVPGWVNVIGSAKTNATVSIWGDNNAYSLTSRKGGYFRGELPATNTANALWLTITNLAVLNDGTNPDIVTNTIGHAFVPKTAELFGYDLDGNLTDDGRWSYTWDAENRLVKQESLSSAPTASKFKLEFAYDAKGRRIQKLVSTNSGSAYVPQYTNRFVYDGWNLLAILNPQSSILQSFAWGLDLSGSLQGAGGVGGLLSVSNASNGVNFCAYDGNGNVAALLKSDGSGPTAQYEYGPFGDVLRATGPMALANPFRFSTKYQDDESDHLYYGYRSYNPSVGRWLSRDPIEEDGGQNLCGFVVNSPLNGHDPLGLSVTDDFKDIGYKFWRRNFVTAPQWRVMMDMWYYEYGPNRAFIVGNSDQRNKDIMNNSGFQHLLNCWVAKKRGEQVPQSSEWEVRDDGFWWHYGYWGFLGLGNSAGGDAAYTSATHFLGSYNTTVTFLGSDGNKDTLEIDVDNTSHWVSGTRTEGIPFIGWLIKKFGSGSVSLITDHARGVGPESPASRGGDWPKNYIFTVKIDHFAKCVLP